MDNVIERARLQRAQPGAAAVHILRTQAGAPATEQMYIRIEMAQARAPAVHILHTQ